MSAEIQQLKATHDFDKSRIDELESNCKQLQRKVEDSVGAKGAAASGAFGSLMPEDMMEQIKKLKNQNSLLKQ